MSDKKINFSYTLSFIEDLPDEVLTTFVGGAGSATPTTGTSSLGNTTNKNTSSSITKVKAYEPKPSKR